MAGPRIRLVALDLTGTTVERDGTILDSTKAAVRACAERGVRFAIATGNTPARARSFAEELGVRPYIIACSGAVVVAPDGTTLGATPFPRQALPALLAVCAKEPVRLGLFVDDIYYVNDPKAAARWSQAHYAPDLLAVVNTDPTLFMVAGPEAIVAELWGRLDGLHSETRLTSPADGFLQVVHRTVSKGAAIVRLGHELGISPEEIMAIGDSRNDVEIVREVGIGVAVANANENVRSVARYVTTAPAGRGVVEALERFILNQSSS